jgi:hypothetical protein
MAPRLGATNLLAMAHDEGMVFVEEGGIRTQGGLQAMANGLVALFAP